jgi:23S rRNA (pseudouridine1915-N3)-methyltransferase
MRVRLLSVGRRMPHWVHEGFREYARRLPTECALELTEIEPGRRPRGSASAAELERIRNDEGERLLRIVAPRDRIIALDVRGTPWSTEQLADALAGWMRDGRDPVLLVGGADGLSDECLRRAERRWSLSPLTFPHQLVRVILAEQLYRAWSLINRHPYHRG